jgi:hypothetical protein
VLFVRTAEGCGTYVITARWTSAIALMTLGAAVLGGCSQLGELPDIAKVPEKVLSKDEQQGKVSKMIEKGQKHQSEAAKEIEEDR